MNDERGHTLTTGAGGPAPTLSVPCTCPGKPHPEDVLTFHSKIPNAMGFAAMYAIRAGIAEGYTEADLRGRVADVMLHNGIESWNKVGPPDTEGKRDPEPVTPRTIDRLLPFDQGGKEALEFADALYSGDLLRPLAPIPPTSLPDTQMDDSTSPPTPSGSKPPKASRPSSPPVSAGTPSNE